MSSGITIRTDDLSHRVAHDSFALFLSDGVTNCQADQDSTTSGRDPCVVHFRR